jgi:hypothetical protein
MVAMAAARAAAPGAADDRAEPAAPSTPRPIVLADAIAWKNINAPARLPVGRRLRAG